LKASARPCFASGLHDSVLVRVKLAHLGGREATWGQGRQLFVDGQRGYQVVREPHSIRLHRMAAPEEKIRDLGLLRVSSARHAVSVQPNPPTHERGGRAPCNNHAHSSRPRAGAASLASDRARHPASRPASHPSGCGLDSLGVLKTHWSMQGAPLTTSSRCFFSWTFT
jgi:hypothetical protein